LLVHSNLPEQSWLAWKLHYFPVRGEQVMKKLIFISLLLTGMLAAASDKKFYETGTLKEMTSVECGVEAKSGSTFMGDLLGTDSSKMQTHKTFCPEYVVASANVVYHIRPRGNEKHPAILPVGQGVQFRMKKDRMVLRVPEGDNKEREYDVVGATPVEKSETTATAKK
jgi:hypothetical protein